MHELLLKRLCAFQKQNFEGWVDNARLAVQSIEKAQRRPGRRVTAEGHGLECCFSK